MLSAQFVNHFGSVPHPNCKNVFSGSADVHRERVRRTDSLPVWLWEEKATHGDTELPNELPASKPHNDISAATAQNLQFTKSNIFLSTLPQAVHFFAFGCNGNTTLFTAYTHTLHASCCQLMAFNTFM